MDTCNTIESPIEDIFDIEKGTTENLIQRSESADIETDEVIDDEDRAIQSQLSTIYDYALETFEQQVELTQQVDSKFAARNAEVAAQYLKIALDATTDRAKIKHDRKKLQLVKGLPGQPGTVNNNLIVADRNDILKKLASIPGISAAISDND